MKKHDMDGKMLVNECRWRIQGALDGGASVQEIADAAGITNVTIYGYLGRLADAVKYGSPRTAERILAVFGARIVVVTDQRTRQRVAQIVETIV